ncbi:Glycerol kinase [Raphanus sativus]|nr:Glycerol kinase [Raphanus sativus]
MLLCHEASLADGECVEAVKEGIKKGDAIFGTIDTWLIWNMTGGSSGGLHVTDVTNASRTMLMNLKTLSWDEDTIKTLGILAEILPKIISNSEVIGEICKGWPIPGIKIAGCLGDQHAAMLGQACKKVRLRVLTELALSFFSTQEKCPSSQTNYALEGSIAIAGAAVQWLRDSLGIIKSASEIEDLAAKVESTGGVYFVPAFNNLFAPWWREDARGVCIGIPSFTNKSHIERAVLESMCFQLKDVLDSMNKDAGEKGSLDDEKGEFLLRVNGGATANNLLMQIQADLMGTPVVRPVDIETTTLGAAYAAGLAVGFWKEEDIFESGERSKNSKIFRLAMEEATRKKKVESWCKAVERTFHLADLSLFKNLSLFP